MFLPLTSEALGDRNVTSVQQFHYAEIYRKHQRVWPLYTKGPRS